jgi:hypothetical protein
MKLDAFVTPSLTTDCGQGSWLYLFTTVTTFAKENNVISNWELKRHVHTSFVLEKGRPVAHHIINLADIFKILIDEKSIRKHCETNDCRP